MSAGGLRLGVLSIATAESAGADGARTRVDVFALAPEDLDGDGAYIGVELIDRGNSVGGATVYEGRAPRFWRAEHL